MALLEIKGLSLTLLITDLLHTFSKGQVIISGTAVVLLQVFDVSKHGLVVLLQLSEGLRHLGKPQIQLRHMDSPHHQPANPSHRL